MMQYEMHLVAYSCLFEMASIVDASHSLAAWEILKRCPRVLSRAPEKGELAGQSQAQTSRELRQAVGF
jgi:hypothetical protein